ncbi:MAG: zf-HC2 domain-containing protein [Anaerolineae bacterium]|nr:MAG: zf-HC2 domain-containing protein [Anaerolineae bacterium]
MTEHVTAWLGAYHDGELQGRRLRQVETHLAHCATCRADLERLQALAALLQESPAAENLTPPERFVAQVGLRLPRRPARPAWQRGLEMGWRLVPVGLLGAWAFVQAVFVVAGAVLVALRMGLGGDVAAELLPASQPGLGLTEIFSLSGTGLNDVGRMMLQVLSSGGPLGWSVTLNLVLLVVIGLLYWSWLASWWARRQQQRTQL